MAAFMKIKMEEDDEITSAQADIKESATDITPPTIGRYIRKKLEWVAVRTRFWSNEFGPKQSQKMCCCKNVPIQ